MHDVVPVIAEPGQALNGLPCLGWVVGQQLVSHHLVHGQMQPRVDRLAAGNHVVIANAHSCREECIGCWTQDTFVIRT